MRRADLKIGTLTTEAGDSIEYWDSGDTTRPVMLLVHGFGATTKYQWFKQVKMLSKKYRVIAPNLNYFGKTVPFETNYTVQGQVEMLERFTRELGIDSLTLFGVSYGGLVSTEFAERNKDKIQKLLLFDTPVKFADSADISEVNDYFNSPSIEELFVPSKPEGLNKLMLLATGKKRRIPAGLLKKFHAKSYAYNEKDKRALISSLLADMNLYASREYDLQMPILLIWGEEDRVVSVDRGRELAEYLGENVEFHVIKKAAHMPNMTHAKEFNRYVSDFLNLRE